MENMAGMDVHQSHETQTMIHMTFSWGHNAEILFSGWPGTRTGMYVLSLVFVFALSVIVEWLSSFCQRVRHDKFSGSLVWSSVMHGIRIGIGYLVMLAVMSFNVGVLVVAVAGHALGFFLFRKSAAMDNNINNNINNNKEEDLIPRAGC